MGLPPGNGVLQVFENICFFFFEFRIFRKLDCLNWINNYAFAASLCHMPERNCKWTSKLMSAVFPTYHLFPIISQGVRL